MKRIRIYVVNLARRLDRRQRMLSILPPGLKVEFTTFCKGHAMVNVFSWMNCQSSASFHGRSNPRTIGGAARSRKAKSAVR